MGHMLITYWDGWDVEDMLGKCWGGQNYEKPSFVMSILALASHHPCNVLILDALARLIIVRSVSADMLLKVQQHASSPTTPWQGCKCHYSIGVPKSPFRRPQQFTMVFRSWYQMGNVLGRLEVLLADSADLKVGARRELQTMILNY